jgi:mono/diheme cytochrome c family protein
MMTLNALNRSARSQVLDAGYLAHPDSATRSGPRPHPHALRLLGLYRGLSGVRLMMAGLLISVLGTQVTLAASPEKGKEAFLKNGCWQCHGTEGQGGSAGLRLAPGPKPLAYISAFIRNTNGPMPPYTEKILPDSDVADIHAYLQSLPPAPDPKTLPALN